MKQISVEYEVGDKASIKMNGIIGEVMGIWVDRDRIQYNVEWASTDDNIHSRWFIESEIRSAGESRTVDIPKITEEELKNLEDTSGKA